MPITVATVKNAVGVLQSLDTAAFSTAVSDHFANINEDATVAEDVLASVAIFWPPAAGIAALIALLVELEPYASIIDFKLDIHGDPNPQADAQLSTGR